MAYRRKKRLTKSSPTAEATKSAFAEQEAKRFARAEQDKLDSN